MTSEGNPARKGRGASEQPFPSTTWTWKRVRVSRAPQANGTDGRKAGRWYHLPRWQERRPLTMTVKYRGGAEGWIEIHSRGSSGRFPGHVALLDVCREIWQTDKPH